jgi:hypothetical protein
MADTGKQSPLGQNVLGGLLQNRCLRINPNAQFFMGISRSNSEYIFGTLVQNTVLRMLVWSINDAYLRGFVGSGTYNNLISINGYDSCYALGNSKPPTYIAEDASESWAGKTQYSSDCKAVEFAQSKGISGALPGPANAGYSVTGVTDYGQQATWLPYNMSNPNHSITQWGWIRCHALQAHNEFNWHAKEGSEGQAVPRYEDFLGSFNEAYSFAQYNNRTISTSQNAATFLEGSFSNMDDLITGDITGVSLYTQGLADDLQCLQKIFDFKRLDRFGFPSTLLQQLYEHGGLTTDLNLALGAAGLEEREIRSLSRANDHGTAEQERKIYTAFLSIAGKNLQVCLSSLTNNGFLLNYRCAPDNPGAISGSTSKIRTLADMLNPWYLFYSCRESLTVPLYNTTTGLPTGSKTYYLIYSDGNDQGAVNPALDSTAVRNVVGTLFTKGKPGPLETNIDVTPNNTLPKGYDSYLGRQNEVIPEAIALAAGAVRYTFLQISNIEQITPGELGNCLQNLELMSDDTGFAVGTGSDPSAGTLQKPVDVSLVSEIQEQMGLGSNVGGNYRMDDFFGNMSGNPYNWRQLYSYLAGDDEIQNVTASAQSSDLAAIYQQLFLAVSWEPVAISLQLEYTCDMTQAARANPVNPDYDPNEEIPNPDWDPSDPDSPEFIPNPDYNPYRFILLDSDPVTYTNNQWNPSLWAAGYRIKPSQGNYDPLTNDGGGYGRGGAPDPAVFINYTTFNSDGSTIKITGIGRNDAQTASNGGGTFGRVQGAEIYGGNAVYFATNIPGRDWESPDPYAPIPAPNDPPDGFLDPEGIFPSYQDPYPGYGAPVANTDVIPEPEYPPVGTYNWRPATGGTNSTYGSSYSYNSVTQYYINAANSEISQISSQSSYDINQVNLIWEIMGKQMKVEQRSRYNGLGRVEIPRDPFTYSNQDLVSFVDSMPDYSDFRTGLQGRVTIELIIDRACDVGQNIMAQMRQERNEKTLANCGIPLNNNIPDRTPASTIRTLVTNGTVPGALEGMVIGDTEWVNPGWPTLGPPGSPEVTAPGVVDNGVFLTPISGTGPGDFTPLTTDVEYPVIGPVISVGPPDTVVSGPNNPNEGEPTTNIPGGGEQGGGTNSGGGTPSGPNNPFVPPQSVQSAIDKVIHCNCDCWDLLG